LTFSVKDCFTFDSLSDVNFGHHFTFGAKNLTSLNTFTLSLQFHAPFDLFRRLDVFDFVSHAVNSPLDRSLVQTYLNRCIQTISFFKCSVKLKFANLRAHRCLCKECQSLHRVINCVTSLVSIANFEIENSVNLYLDVVFCDCGLIRHIDDLLLKTVMIAYLINER